MSLITHTSELEAINTIIGQIGMAPLNSLDGGLPADVITARNLLAEKAREVLEEGWSFNTEEDYPLTRDHLLEIQVPENIVRLKLSPSYNWLEGKVVQRGTHLYNKYSHSYIFDFSLEATVVVLLPWEKIPQAFRQYIVMLAARAFVDRVIGDQTMHAYSEAELKKAYAAATRYESKVEPCSIFDHIDVAAPLMRNVGTGIF